MSGFALLAYAGYKYGFIDRIKDVVAPDRKAEGTVSKDDFGAASAPAAAASAGATAASAPLAGGGARLNRPIRVAIVLWGGYAGGIMANGGLAPNKESVFFRSFGIQVELLRRPRAAAALLRSSLMAHPYR